MRYNFFLITGVISFLIFSPISGNNEFWGFFGHRLINRTAVFTLPVDLIPLYKSNIEFITDHSIDPDKRRYAAPQEAVRHYIDLDVWGKHPYLEVPRTYPEAMAKYGEIQIINRVTKDTVATWSGEKAWSHPFSESHRNQILSEIRIRLFELIANGFLELPGSWLMEDYVDHEFEIIFTDGFSEYGILPYHLSLYQNRLTSAFKNNDWPLVIRLSTEIGHYLSDAHVPLHTTQNYNGQMTGQDGIHAFWESRIPELFATESYDFFVGRAKYIEDTDAFFWNIILDSNSHVAEVLAKELELRQQFDRDKQYCFEQRGAVTTRLECREYAEAYQNTMSGMVEKQMRKSIQAVGSSWYTAWVDAGRPAIKLEKSLNKIDTMTMLTIDSLSLQNQ